jgi:hypothetical protein
LCFIIALSSRSSFHALALQLHAGSAVHGAQGAGRPVNAATSSNRIARRAFLPRCPVDEKPGVPSV